jgi:hypothetical protein
MATDYPSAPIIHFTGIKPDHAECKNPARVVYMEHRQQTPWAGKPLISKHGRELRRLHWQLRKLPQRIADGILSLVK